MGVVGGRSPMGIVHLEKSIVYRKQIGDLAGQSKCLMHLAQLQVCLFVKKERMSVCVQKKERQGESAFEVA